MGLVEQVRRYAAAGLIAATAAFASPHLAHSQPLEARVEQAEAVPKKSGRVARWWLYSILGSAAALGAAHVVLRARGRRKTPLQPAVEHPYLAGVTTAAAFGASYLGVDPEPTTQALAQAAIIGGAPAFGLAWLFRDVIPNYALNTLRLARDSVRVLRAQKDPARRHKILEQMRGYIAAPERAEVEIIDALFQQERVDDALLLLKYTCKRIDHACSSLALDRALVHPLSRRVARKIAPNDHFGNFYASLRQGSVEDALASLDSFAHDSPSPSRFAARAYVTHELARMLPSLKRAVPKAKAMSELTLEQRAAVAWQDAIAVILNDRVLEQRFLPMGESRNEVLEYAANQFLKQLLVFKRCGIKDRQRLIDERENVQYFRRYLGNKVVESLAYVEHEGKAYHITLHGSGRTLEHVLQVGRPEDQELALKSAAGLLARIHAVELTCLANPATSADYYSGRLQDVFYRQLASLGQQVSIPEGLSKLLDESGRRVQRALADSVQGAYKDANPRNWLIEKDGFAVAIDFEHRVRLPVHLDLVSLLEFGPAVVVDDESLQYFLNPLSRVRCARPAKTVLDTYFSDLNLHDEYDCAEFLEHYRWAALQRHLELAGYRLRDSESGNAREWAAVAFHVGRAQSYACAVGENALSDALGKITFRGAEPSAGR
jgi:hypothetical protein